MSVFIYPDGSGGASAGPALLGTIDFTALGSATYTTTGAKTLGGLSFTAEGVDGTNTIDISATGLQGVGGTTQQVGIQFDPSSHLSFSPTALSVVGCTVLLASTSDMVSGDILSAQVGTSVTSRVIFNRQFGEVAAGYNNGSPQTEYQTSVASTIDMRALGLITSGLLGSVYYQGDSDPGAVAPNTMASKAVSNGALNSSTAFTWDWMRLAFVKARGRPIESVSFWDYSGLL